MGEINVAWYSAGPVPGAQPRRDGTNRASSKVPQEGFSSGTYEVRLRALIGLANSQENEKAKPEVPTSNQPPNGEGQRRQEERLARGTQWKLRGDSPRALQWRAGLGTGAKVNIRQLVLTVCKHSQFLHLFKTGLEKAMSNPNLPLKFY